MLFRSKPSDRLQFETVIACGDSCGCSSVGRAPRCQRGCRGFESLHPLFFIDFGLRRSGTGPETSAAAVSLLTLDIYSRSELACCSLRLFPQRRSIRPSELLGIVCSSRTLPGVRCIQRFLCNQDGIRNACELFASCPIVRSRCSSSSRPDLLSSSKVNDFTGSQARLLSGFLPQQTLPHGAGLHSFAVVCSRFQTKYQIGRAHV